jgi:UDP-2,4-diacetamido-2,4,6-trideoxy-beta-L-altropyranose hydrolase
MRCLALSEELIRRKNTCFFLSKVNDNELINRIEKNNIYHKKIDPNTTLQADLEGLIKFSNENDVDWVITDHYGINSQYIKEIKKNNLKVLSIDDTAQIHYYSDIIVNQNIGAEKLDIKGEDYTNFLLGPKYVILRDELLRRKEKKIKRNVENLMITLGGTDQHNYTLKILKQLSNIKIKKIVVIGVLNPHYKKIKDYIKNKIDFKIIVSPEYMLDLYLKADIAISAGGTTCYELAYFGIPNIIITITENQNNIARSLHEKEVSIYFGDKKSVKLELLKNTLLNLMKNDLMRMKMINNGKKLVDGKGKKRIVEFMEKYI